MEGEIIEPMTFEEIEEMEMENFREIKEWEDIWEDDLFGEDDY
jgi:hypothetical protein